MLEEIMNTYLLPMLATIITGLASYVGLKIKSMYEKYVDTQTKKEIVNHTVKYVEQICKTTNVTSQEKFELAKTKTLEWLNNKGIPISDTELEILIESAVIGLTENVK